MKKIFLLLLLMAVGHFLKAQVSVKGTVRDTLDNKPLQNAIVVLLSSKDSALVAFTRTAKNGAFELPNINPGKYSLLITYPRFADLNDDITISDKAYEAGTIALTLKSKLLDAVIISTAAAIRIKGDTTEFVADSFKVRDGATVEELLKKLPGFQVDSKGQIKAQGKKVDKVLVDGEEFFGDDPTMATQNLSAKIVDKVQVYDTKTDQQNLTGITNNNDGKTVNIKLKADAKKGAFGKASAGTDFKKLFDSKLLYNKFAGNKKLSVYGTKTNLSTGSLNWEERRKLGIDNDMEYDEVGDYYYSYNDDGDFSDWSLQGLPSAYTAGGFYSNKWNADKQSINLSYRYNQLKTNNEASTRSQNILPDAILYNNTETFSNSFNRQHAVNGKWIWKLDSLTTVTFTTAGNFKTSSSYNNTFSETIRDRDTLNKNHRVNDNNTDQKKLDNQLQYKQLFKKKDRQLLVNLRFGTVNDKNNGILTSETRFYKSGMVDSLSVLDQQKFFDGQSYTYGAKVTYNEPITAKLSLAGEYSYNQNNSESYRNTYDKSAGGKYEVKNPLFSNNFDLTAQSNSGKAMIKYVTKKFRSTFGSGISAIQLKLHNLDAMTRNNFNFLNITPQAQFSYTPKPQSNIRLSYQGSTQQPNINQLQPLRNNSDPLNEYVGNPDLKVGFRHRLGAGYYFYKILSGINLYTDASYGFTNRAITNENFVDTKTGKRIYRPVNVSGNTNWSLYGYFGKGEGEKKLRHHANIETNGGRNVTLVNSQSGVTNYKNLSFSYGIGYEVSEKYNFDISPKIGYSGSKSSFNSSIATNYLTYGGEANAFVKLPWKMELKTDVDFDLRQNTAAFGRSGNIVLWNSELAKKVFKDGSGKIMIAANDILNQNKGYNRIIETNFVSDEKYLRRSRYVLLKFEWSFTKMPGGVKQAAGDK